MPLERVSGGNENGAPFALSTLIEDYSPFALRHLGCALLSVFRGQPWPFAMVRIEV